MKKVKFVLFLFVTLFLICSCSLKNKDHPSTDVPKNEVEEQVNTIYLYINDKVLTVEIETNVATKALLERLNNSDITYIAHDYGGFEKTGDLDKSLPTINSNIKATTFDVMLYNAKTLVIFYESNTWSYTPIGRITGVTKEELKKILKVNQENIEITISKEKK